MENRGLVLDIHLRMPFRKYSLLQYHRY